jgi:hypothetical protein
MIISGHWIAGWRRLLIILIAGAIAAVSARSAAIGIFEERLPAQALTLDPTNPVALMKMVDSELAVGGVNLAPKPHWRADAITALRQKPINPAAMRTLGLIAANNGRADEARLLMNWAERLSRRGGLAQLWLLQDAAQRDDARAALDHIDIALSVHDDLSPLVFPVLLQVLQDRRYGLEFAKLVEHDRPWLGSFLTFANTNNPDPKALADVVSFAGGLPPGPAFRIHETNILWSLANARMLERSSKLLLDLRRATHALLADGRFNEATIDAKLGPFAWTGSTDPDVSSSLERDGTVRILIAPRKSGMVLQRYFGLSTGTYRISADARRGAENMKASVGLEVSCATSPDAPPYTVTTIIVQNSDAVEGNFSVPANCPLQLVRFTVRGGDVQTDSAITLSRIGLTKLNQTPDRQPPVGSTRTSMTR